MEAFFEILIEIGKKLSIELGVYVGKSIFKAIVKHFTDMKKKK